MEDGRQVNKINYLNYRARTIARWGYPTIVFVNGHIQATRASKKLNSSSTNAREIQGGSSPTTFACHSTNSLIYRACTIARWGYPTIVFVNRHIQATRASTKLNPSSTNAREIQGGSSPTTFACHSTNSLIYRACTIARWGYPTIVFVNRHIQATRASTKLNPSSTNAREIQGGSSPTTFACHSIIII